MTLDIKASIRNPVVSFGWPFQPGISAGAGVCVVEGDTCQWVRV